MAPTSSSNDALPAVPSLAVDFDDLSEGIEFETLARTITEADVVAFANLTGDRHPQHVDDVFARDSVFGERIAHGMLLLSYAVGLMPLDPFRIVALRRISDATFKAPVRLGDTIRVWTRIVRVKPLDDDFGMVGMQWKVLNQEGTTVLRARADVLWRRAFRPAADGGAATPERAAPPL
jgi:3-hydroxybutyryl-CoA dehydratase